MRDRDPGYFVYILASGRRGTLYVGVTNDPVKRVSQHRLSGPETFVGRYAVTQLVYLERHLTAEAAITREKQIKRWNRAWKIRLIEEQNFEWVDRFSEMAS